MKGDTRFIRTLQLRNLLSFGPESEPIKLGPLNVLIGPNGSGKSNIIEAIDLLRASATELVAPIRATGGTEEWLWKGCDPRLYAVLYATIRPLAGKVPIRHSFSFSSTGQRFRLVDEAIHDQPEDTDGVEEILTYFSYESGVPFFLVPMQEAGEEGDGGEREYKRMRRKNLAPDQSVLTQRRDPDRYPEITYLGEHYRQFRLYREWDIGRNGAPRIPQSVDQPNDFLAEDASNLGLVLSHLGRTGNLKDTLDALISRFYDRYRDYSVSVEGGTVQVFLREKDLKDWIPATRISDGTLRFLCLASILCHPSPKPLICIEEPEIGLHPDILPTVAEMLIEASERTQIIVTTHSDILVDALSHVPEAVLVCEKESNSTSVRRLDQDALRKWLDKYTLGELWRSGELGGNRW